MRVKKVTGRELRDCPVCLVETGFELYESWERPSRRSKQRLDLRASAQCEVCGFKLVAGY